MVCLDFGKLAVRFAAVVRLAKKGVVAEPLWLTVPVPAESWPCYA